MKDIKTVVTESIQSGSKNYVAEAVNNLLGGDVASGKTVAVIDDPIYGFSGAKGKVKGESRQGSGFVDVELENGTTMPMQTSLLVPVRD
jgi:hypothetical protein